MKLNSKKYSLQRYLDRSGARRSRVVSRANGRKIGGLWQGYSRKRDQSRAEKALALALLTEHANDLDFRREAEKILSDSAEPVSKLYDEIAKAQGMLSA